MAWNNFVITKKADTYKCQLSINKALGALYPLTDRESKADTGEIIKQKDGNRACDVLTEQPVSIRSTSASQHLQR